MRRLVVGVLDERGGNRYVQPKATAPHLDTTKSRLPLREHATSAYPPTPNVNTDNISAASPPSADTVRPLPVWCKATHASHSCPSLPYLNLRTMTASHLVAGQKRPVHYAIRRPHRWCDRLDWLHVRIDALRPRPARRRALPTRSSSCLWICSCCCASAWARYAAACVHSANCGWRITITRRLHRSELRLLLFSSDAAAESDG
jgi:hypothetical protein